MKISRVRHVVITCIIFLVIIAIIITLYNNKLEAIASNTEKLMHRVIAVEDILPGETITEDNTKVIQVQDVVKVKNLIYRLSKNDDRRESVDDNNEYYNKIMSGQVKRSIPNDNRWAVGKVATSKIYKGEMLVEDDLKLPEEITGEEERIYSIPFDSLTTGGYNVNIGDKVDICVLYDDDDKNIKEYQDLENNKVIDIVLAKKEIADIRDEAGSSKLDNSQVVPGYICFKLSYDEINKVELAKRQGNVFVGIVESYIGDAHAETFMSGSVLPTFSTVK